jgi:hypothetical protein
MRPFYDERPSGPQPIPTYLRESESLNDKVETKSTHESVLSYAIHPLRPTDKVED